MASDTITFILDGSISLAPFAQAFNSLNGLIVALAAEEGAGKVDWIIEDLAPSSAIVTLRGHSANPEAVERIVRAYESIGYALQYHEPIRRSPRVERPALTIGRLAGTKVKAVRFETAEREAIITSRPSVRHMKRLGHVASLTPQLHPPFSEQQPGAYGAVEGAVQTLTKRHGLRFTLYDSLNDRAVSCYLEAGYEEIMRDMWGKRAIVQGWVTRDPSDGRPLTVRRIHNVTPVTEEGDYTRARAVSPRREGDLPPEERIRRLRDA